MQDSPWEENGRRWLEVCRVLLEAGADPDAEYDCGEIRRSPIYFAYLAGNVELLDLLLQAGANPRSKAWLQLVNAEPRPDAWLEQQRPETRDRLCRWETEQEALRLDATLPGATKAVPNSRARLTAGRALGRVALGWCVVDPVEARWAGDRGRHAALCYGPGARWATAVVGRRRPPHLCGGLPSLVAPAQRVRGVTGHRRRGEGTATGCPPPCG
ncbi:hypothetical protein G6F65_018572 [Rhizopus arrhizus]|nr:hypothetical protein G6F65_018572 [Rhizopus arrhizus]